MRALPNLHSTRHMIVSYGKCELEATNLEETSAQLWPSPHYVSAFTISNVFSNGFKRIQKDVNGRKTRRQRMQTQHCTRQGLSKSMRLHKHRFPDTLFPGSRNMRNENSKKSEFDHAGKTCRLANAREEAELGQVDIILKRTKS